MEYLDLHFEIVRRDEHRKDLELDAKLANLIHIQRYRYFSVASGCLLALASLGICGFAVHQSVDITPLAFVLGPLAGLAGVFIWGYRPPEKNGEPAAPKAEGLISMED